MSVDDESLSVKSVQLKIINISWHVSAKTQCALFWYTMYII